MNSDATLVKRKSKEHYNGLHNIKNPRRVRHELGVLTRKVNKNDPAEAIRAQLWSCFGGFFIHISVPSTSNQTRRDSTIRARGMRVRTSELLGWMNHTKLVLIPDCALTTLFAQRPILIQRLTLSIKVIFGARGYLNPDCHSSLPE